MELLTQSIRSWHSNKVSSSSLSSSYGISYEMLYSCNANWSTVEISAFQLAMKRKFFYTVAKINHHLTGYQDKSHNARQSNPFNVIELFWSLPLPYIAFQGLWLEFSQPMSFFKFYIKMTHFEYYNSNGRRCTRKNVFLPWFAFGIVPLGGAVINGVNYGITNISSTVQWIFILLF